MAVALLFLAGSMGYLVGTSQAEEGNHAAADVGFLTDMIAHHEQAVEMSQIALGRDLPPTVRSFAQEVVSDQRYEIGLMEATLRDWGKPSVAPDGKAMAWMNHEVDVDKMPGLATDEQLDHLSDLNGDALASEWIRLMSAHHQGGVHMADSEVRLGKDPYVRDLAQRMSRVQRSEIAEYELTKERLGLA